MTVNSWAERMRKGRTERGVAIRSVIRRRVVCLVSWAVRKGARHSLPSAVGELRIEVDARVNMRQIPRSALASEVRAEVSVTILGEDDARSDAAVCADEAAIAVACRAVCAV